MWPPRKRGLYFSLQVADAGGVELLIFITALLALYIVTDWRI